MISDMGDGSIGGQGVSVSASTVMPTDRVRWGPIIAGLFAVVLPLSAVLLAVLLAVTAALLTVLLPVGLRLLPVVAVLSAVLLPLIAGFSPVVASLLPILASLFAIARGELFRPAFSSQPIAQSVAPFPD